MMSAYSCSSCTTSLHRVICERTTSAHCGTTSRGRCMRRPPPPCSPVARNVGHRSITAPYRHGCMLEGCVCLDAASTTGMPPGIGAGANLTTANHAIFVHPLHVPSLQKYIACETQAIGRVRRYGQKRKVHLWRYLATDTIDTTIYEERTAAAEQLEEKRLRSSKL